MKFYDSDRIRNIVLLGSAGSGKTSLAEAVLFNTEANNRLGSVDNATSICDFMEEEQEKKMSINGCLAATEYKDTKINLLDAPGSSDFQGEPIRMAYAADAFVMVVDASVGIDARAMKMYEYVEGKPGLVFVNKMEVDRANFEITLSQIRDRISSGALPLCIPMGLEKNFTGIIDLIKEKAIMSDETGKNVREEEIPDDYKDEVAKYKEQLVEAIVETNEEIMEKYLEGEKISNELLIKTFAEGAKKGDLLPVLCGAAGKNVGVYKVLENIVTYMPSAKDVGNVLAIDKETGEEIEYAIDPDGDFAAFVFKNMTEGQAGESTFFKVYSGKFSGGEVKNITADASERVNNLYTMRGKEKIDIESVGAGDIAVTVKLKNTHTNDTLSTSKDAVEFKKIEFPESLIAIAVVPKTKADQDKLGSALTKIKDEDPTLKVDFNPEFLQTIVSGMGEQHLNIVLKRLKNRNNLDVEVEKPRIAYRETIRKQVNAEKKYKKQSGGKGQYGHCLIEMHPLERGKGFEFEDKIFGGSIPAKYVPAVEKGCKEAMDKGILAGYPVIDVKVVVYDGSYHNVDSSDMAFKLAGSMAFKDGMEKANPVILEPIMEVEVIVPDEYMGDIMGDVNGRRGRIMGTEAYKKGFTLVRATVPEAEMYKYINDLRSMTQGQGTFLMKFSHYDPAPSNVQDKIIEETKKLEEEAAAK